MNSTTLIDSRIGKALRGIRTAFRAKLTALATAPQVQLVQGEALAGEKMQAVELMQHFGFSSAPPAGTQLVVVPLAGKTAKSVIVATENGAFRIAVEQGETCIYNQWGAKITFKKEKDIEVECDHFIVKAKEGITMQTKSWTAQASAGTVFESPSLSFGGMGGGAAKASLAADMNITGNTSQHGSVSTSGDQVAGGISQMKHTHTGDSGGTTGAPQ